MAGKLPKFKMPEGEHAGDVTAQEAWDILVRNPGAVLVDVRTKGEWQLIGKPDLSTIDHEPIYLQWVTTAGINARFVEELGGALEERGIARDAPVFIMCQSGGRSKIAAKQCASLGYTASYNVADGFEGDLDDLKHRNSINGWKVAGLPWTQS